MQESTLHARLKQFYTQDGGLCEVWVDGYLIDVVKGEQLIEIQTGNFSVLKSKLEALIDRHPIMVAYPIAIEKYILTKNEAYVLTTRRKSPKRGRVENLFNELVFIPRLAAHPNFSLEVLLTGEEEERIADGKGSWRRNGISIEDRRLVSIFQRVHFAQGIDYAGLIPKDLDAKFTNTELAKALKIPLRLATKMTYCLSRMGVLQQDGKRGRAYLYQLASPESRL
jgi:hypothetical protein